MGLFSWLFKPIDSKKISSEGIRIDVRTTSEFRGGHIEGAKNIPLDVLTTKIGKIVKKKEQLVGVYCASGMRSGMAKRRLRAMGYTNVVNEGGLPSVRARLNK